ncbi:MAG: DUF1127 domain-containing protein [Hyphomonadaceae bacterium]|nr:DUF1127 domain-containing protein [Hyphomonadaceae bacterium]
MSPWPTLCQPERPRVWRDFYLPILRRARRAFKAWRAVRRVERELNALSDRMLKDIGLTRCEIGRIARQGRPVPRARLLRL